MNMVPGVTDATLTFLRDLAANNNRDWFLANKKTYEAEYKIPARHFADALTQELQTLTGLPHKSKTFRINRDLRFSKDKTPYKAHLHIAFMPTDQEGAPAWFYGLNTDRLSLGTGIFGFEKKALDTFRKAVAETDTIGKTVANLRAAGIRINEPALKKVPPGFPKDHPQADLLRHKALHAWIDLPDWTPGSDPHQVKTVIGAFKKLKPMFDLLMDA